jgi:hypothetical protein
MTNRGFKGFRQPSRIEAEQLTKALERMSLETYIYWTGGEYRRRTQSLRSNALACLTEKKRPVHLKTWIQRAAQCVDADQHIGYVPERVREGLYLHRNSKPAVYFELKKDAKGNYVSVNHVPYAEGFAKGLKPGDIVVPARERAEKEVPRAKGKGKQQLPAPQPEAGVTEQPAG